jgi:hypothetical protein
VKEAGRLVVAAQKLRDSKQWEKKEDFVKQLAIDKIRGNHNRDLEMVESVESIRGDWMDSLMRNDGTRCLMEGQEVGESNDFRYRETIIDAYEKYDALFSKGLVLPPLSSVTEEAIVQMPAKSSMQEEAFAEV